MIESIEAYRNVIRDVLAMLTGIADNIQVDTYCRDNKPLTAEQRAAMAESSAEGAIETLANVSQRLRALVHPDVIVADHRGAHAEIDNSGTVRLNGD